MRVVFRKFGGVRFEVFGGAAQQRPGLTAQAPLQLAQGLRACGLVGGGFGRDGAALPGADVEPRLEGDAREKRAGAARYSVVKPACEPERSFSYSSRPMTGTR